MDQIAFFDTGISQGQFKGLQFCPMAADPLGEENLLRNQPGYFEFF
jgi:hypothetical protein